jgi:DNA-binding response OmpR family regulator
MVLADVEAHRGSPSIGEVMSLLVVEDDEAIGRLLESGLRANGYRVTWHRLGAAAAAAAREHPFDLILLDLGLPDCDGIALCRDLRMLLPKAVIVMLTARRDEMDVVAGLESGADDYLTKPFGLVELLARVRAHLRRADPATPSRGEPMTVGPLVVDLAARTCTIGGAEVPLRAKELDLLARLTRDAGVAVTRESLMSDVWDENWFGSTKTLDVHIASLRRRLADVADEVGVNPPTISTLRGYGYRLERAPG